MNPTLIIDHEPIESPHRHLVRALLRIEGTPPDGGTRIPLNLAVVLDNSGSMSGEKLRFARDAASQLLAKVHPHDVTSVVTFESLVEVVAAAAPRASQRDLSSRIARIRSAGCTNLSGGWLEGRQQVERFRKQDASNRILLMTDGLANQGITDPEELARLLSQARVSGVTTSTIGFGRDFDERLLATLADAGGGNTHYIEHPDQAPAVFGSELNELLTLSAQNLVARVGIAAGAKLAAVHHSYPRTASPDGGLELRLGDLYASEPKELLLELVVEASGDGPVEIATITLTGAAKDADGTMQLREVRLPIAFSPAEGPVVHPEVRRTLVFLEAARARREALDEERRGRVREAAVRLRDAAHLVREAGDDAEAVEEARDLRLMADMLSAGTFRDEERKYTSQRSYDRARSKRKAEILSRTRREREERREP